MDERTAKDVEVKVIPANIARPFVKAHHYSGKVVNNSCLHFGAFLGGRLHGVMSYGPPMDKSKLIKLVDGSGWYNFMELNRMAFDEFLPRFSESHCIAKSIKLIKKNAPQVKWIVSFADATQCGDGTIYRASNFVLTGITENKTIMEFPSVGIKISDLVLTAHPDQTLAVQLCRALGIPPRPRSVTEWKKLGGRYIPGFMLRYIYFIDPKWRKRLTVPVIPFSEIDKLGAGMYKGAKVSREERNAAGKAEKEARQMCRDQQPTTDD